MLCLLTITYTSFDQLLTISHVSLIGDRCLYGQLLLSVLLTEANCDVGVALCNLHCRGERILQIHTLTGQELSLPSSDWTRANKLFLLSNQIMSLKQSFTPNHRTEYAGHKML